MKRIMKTKMMKPTIKEAIIVEGKDDTAAILRAVNGKTIETHGFGMPEKIWPLIDKAYKECGIIIFTDPDYAGEKIRRKESEKYPDARHAFLPRNQATKKNDIGVENAEPEDIIEALNRAKCTAADETAEFTMEDMDRYGLSGGKDSKYRRERLGAVLSIGYGNTRTFLKKLNGFGITREAFEEAVKEIK